MTDVIKIALERRTKLQEEIAKLDEFVRMAEMLMRNQDGGGQSAPSAAPAAPVMQAPAADPAPTPPAAEKVETKDVPRPSIIRRGLAAS